MSIKDMLNQDMKAALKAGEKDRLSVIRMAKSAILYAEKEKLHELNDEEIIGVLFREVKKKKARHGRIQATWQRRSCKKP